MIHKTINKKYIFISLLILGSLIFGNSVLAQICPRQTTVEGQTVTFVGELTDTGGEATSVWFEYGRTTGYELRTHEKILRQEGDYCITVSNLLPCTTYHYRAAARNLEGTSYGENKTFTTACVSRDEIKVNKLVRNLSDGTGWLDQVSTDPNEVVSFSIRVVAGGQNAARNIIVRATLPTQIIYRGNLRIDNVSSGENIISGLNIGDIMPGQSKTITFEARVASEGQFSYGDTNLTSTAVAHNPETTDTDTAKIVVNKRAVAGVAVVAGAATEVKTGIVNRAFDYILLPFAITFIIILVFKNYLIFLNEWLEKKKNETIDYRAKRTLRKVISKIRVREKLS